ncbi:glycosyltransferase [Solirubrobacter taibaiensis]|nr:glycosyltransferase [Solirubrobacter taibaiensis]
MTARAVDDLSAATGEVLVIRAGARLTAGFVERLRAAAGEAGTVATVAAIAHGSGDPDEVAQRSLRMHPRTTRLTLDCTLVTRAALALAGPLDEGFGGRCDALGLAHVVADDVLVRGTEPTSAVNPLDRHEHSDLPLRPATRLERALTWTRRVADGLEVTLDGRMLRTLRSGTEVQLLALARALTRTGAVRLRLLVGEQAPDVELDGVELIRDVVGARRTAIAHRPYQLSGAQDLHLLAHVGERLVVTHLDLLLYRDPLYHASPDTWAGYRRLTGAGLAAADLVVAISDHVAQDLVAEDLVPAGRLRRVYLGTDHEDPGPASPPAGLEPLDGRPFLVQLGSDLRHKNRPFAIDLLHELRALGWTGGLVLAGPGVEHGSSRAEEDARSLEHVVRLGSVSDSERRWLYREAAAVLYPSTDEGFGLVPFEAAAAGTLPLTAPVSAMRELLGDEHALLVPWDAATSAQRVLPALGRPDAIVAAVRARGEQLTWDRTAREYLELYDQTLALPSRAAAVQAFQALAAEAGRGHWEGTYWALRQELGPTGLALVGADGALPQDAQRALAALTSRKFTREALLRALRLAGKVGRAR